MYPLIRRYLRRVDVVYLLLCAACSAISVVVLLSIGQTQLGSNNKASVQLSASLLVLMLAVVFSTADYHALARAWPLHGVVAWGLVLPTLFLHNVNTGLVTIGYDAGGTSNYSWYRVGGMTFQPAELAKISFILTLALHLSQVRGQVNRPKNLLLLFAAMAFTAVGMSMMVDMRLVLSPADGLADTIGKCTGRGVGFGKNIVDLSCVVVTCAVSYLFSGRITAIGLGTLIAMICVGRLAALFQLLFYEPLLRRAGLPEAHRCGASEQLAEESA